VFISLTFEYRASSGLAEDAVDDRACLCEARVALSLCQNIIVRVISDHGPASKCLEVVVVGEVGLGVHPIRVGDHHGDSEGGHSEPGGLSRQDMLADERRHDCQLVLRVFLPVMLRELY
jgi:hypothetical protein